MRDGTYRYVLFMYSFIAPISTSGPFWYKLLVETDACKKYWWTNLL